MNHEPLPAIPRIPKGRYRHTKSKKIYEVVGIALHSETLEPLVVYRPAYPSEAEFFVRPYKMFVENIEIDGRSRPRFEKTD